ncbi:SGNH/GDSL hydrolase family protein [Pseudorhodoferax sp.]|uniref:SGNH/GDSL hydrolase family protein n=1 Tax=Pseudorhodoferax sp. TaxID=1993553 RepID=UPI002DD638BE|nr:SGNH/GDSL hydrolase family protein [Pseudorhodoferax sp.]
MHSRLRRLGALLTVATAALLGSAAAVAGPYSSLTVFGDSLSDTGNIQIATGGATPPAPYYNGRFSDGPNWIDVLAAGLGLPGGALPALAGGSNYAFGGARTGIDNNPPGVLAQVAGLWGSAHAVADASGLYVVVGGGNDMRDARGATSTDASRQAAAAAAAANIFDSVALLASRGAQHVLISTLPDLGRTPEAVALDLVAPSSDATQRYNALVWAMEAQLEALFSGLDVVVLDMNGIGQAIYDDPAAYGISNVALPCTGFGAVTGGACSTSLFSDALHPSAVAHTIIGNAALALVVPAAVPLPATAALAGLGLLVLGWSRRRGTQAARAGSPV